MDKLKLTTIAALLLAATQALAAPACSGSGPAYKVALVELYTSEGCSSCPPADNYISGLRASGVTPAQAVLLSLHVDYWNYIGWKDPFSRKAFTERQRSLADFAGTRTIYTPEFIVGGRELRNWQGSLPATVAGINRQPAQAAISIALGAPGAAGLPVEVVASASKGGTLHVALVESGLEVKVAAGENDGRKLRHDYVVREWLAPQQLSGDGKAVLSRVVPIPAGALGANLAVSAFVQGERGEILQAYSRPVCGS